MNLVQRLRKRLKAAALFVAALLGAFVVIEGLSSTVIFAHDIVFRPNRGLRSRVHVQYDTLLGWVNIPNLHLPDMYGPGVFFRTNAQSFRNDHDFSVGVPTGKRRVICSGDSFTLGIGVDNAHTWCELLATKDPRLETANLGNAGYGVDQSYLLYKREGAPLDHDLQIFAVIPSDFLRIASSQFVGYGKPVLRVRNADLVTDNVPVPRYPRIVPWFIYNTATFQGLRAVQLGERIVGKAGAAAGRGLVQALSDRQTQEVALTIFEDLARINRVKGSTIVFVLLEESITGTAQAEGWRQFLERELGQRRLPFVDLLSGFRRLPYEDLQAMYRPGWGHYSIRGNQYVADQLYERLLTLPEVAARLSGRRPR